MYVDVDYWIAGYVIGELSTDILPVPEPIPVEGHITTVWLSEADAANIWLPSQ